MRIIIPTLLPLMWACGSDDGVKAYNTDPSADITSHEDGDELLSGYSIIFKGSVSDVNHNNADLKVTWLTTTPNCVPSKMQKPMVPRPVRQLYPRTTQSSNCRW